MRWRYCSRQGGGEGEDRGADNKLQEDLQTLQGKGEEMTGCRRRQRHCRAVLGKIEGLGHRHSLA